MAHPQEGERYYLRLLLLNVPGATSLNDLQTHNSKFIQYYSLKINENKKELLFKV